jgi:hypothetical protein
MQAMPIRIFLVLFILVLIYPSSLVAATERRIALVIGNSAYSSGPLKNPVNDAVAMAAQLQKLGFTVILKKNANLRGMEDSLTDFGNRLKRGGVGLFFYAGHGLQVGGVNYLVPIGAKINRESDIKYDTLDTGKVLDEMANANNGLNIVILDACRDNPYTRSFRNAARGLAILSNAPSGTFISYSTGPGNVARDGEGRNSPYTAALIKHMTEQGQPVEQVFKKVRQTLASKSGGTQIPWELSSLQGNFFFVPGSARTATESSPAEMQLEKRKPGADNTVDELELAMAKIQQQKEDKAAQKAEREEKFRTLLADVKKYKTIIKEVIDAETKVAAWRGLTKKYPSWSAGLETGHADKIVAMAINEDIDGSFKKITGEEGFIFDFRFIDSGNGTVLDTSTSLMWAARDNGSDINWANAKSYCENYRGGDYTDWRMPTQDELAKLYDVAKTYKSDCEYNVHLTGLIRLTCTAPWASETKSSEAARFDFSTGKRYWDHQSNDYPYRALPVRSGK